MSMFCFTDCHCRTPLGHVLLQPDHSAQQCPPVGVMIADATGPINLAAVVCSSCLNISGPEHGPFILNDKVNHWLSAWTLLTVVLDIVSTKPFWKNGSLPGAQRIPVYHYDRMAPVQHVQSWNFLPPNYSTANCQWYYNKGKLLGMTATQPLSGRPREMSRVSRGVQRSPTYCRVNRNRPLRDFQISSRTVCRERHGMHFHHTSTSVKPRQMKIISEHSSRSCSDQF